MNQMFSIKSIRKWHLLLLWPALIITTIYLLSALSHPLMAWTGPQAKTMYPPTIQTDITSVENISNIIQLNDLRAAKIAKLVPYKSDVLLQITESKDTARRYFSLKSGQELKRQDQQQAIWLAQHYTGLKPNISSIELKTEFDQEYSWVNRLLPVYKINFNTDDNLSVFIHTETQALAGITNDWKRVLVFIFRNFHSFSWLDNAEPIRLIGVSIMMLIILTMATTGLLFLVKIKRKKAIPNQKRKWHRKLAWVSVAPLLLFTVSGIYHLIQMSIIPPEAGSRLSQSINLKEWQTSANIKTEHFNRPINQISLVQTNTPMYRISYASIGDTNNNREKRFKGLNKESDVLYIHAQTGEPLGNLDIALIKKQALQIFKVQNIDSLDAHLVTRFGPTYDFRNKRLPVWQISSSTENEGRILFIDPITHILVDQNTSLSRAESYSFSFLHKWNMFIPVMGRFKRDVLIVSILGVSFVLIILGILLHLRRKKSRTNGAQEENNTSLTNRTAA